MLATKHPWEFYLSYAATLRHFDSRIFLVWHPARRRLAKVKPWARRKFALVIHKLGLPAGRALCMHLGVRLADPCEQGSVFGKRFCKFDRGRRAYRLVSALT